MSILGTPKGHTMFFNMKLSILDIDIIVIDSASIHFVKYSIVNTKIYVIELPLGMGQECLYPMYGKAMG